MDEVWTAIFILNSTAGTLGMMCLWISVIISACVLANRTQLKGLYALAGYVSPSAFFYIYKLFNVWDVGASGILYSRLADIALAVGILHSLRMMFKSAYNGKHSRIS